MTFGQLDVTHGGDLTIEYGARTVLDTAGNFVVGLPSSSDYVNTISVSFPDFSKALAWNWQWETIYNGGSNYASGNRSDVYISVLPQEWSATTILAAVPAGCNFFASKVRLNRTTSPTKTFNGQTVGVKPDQNVWIPYTGSILVEAQLNMARAFSLYIDSGNLILHRQQTIGPAPGGFQQYGDTATVSGQSNKGGIWYDIDAAFTQAGFGLFNGWTVFNDPATMSSSNTGTQTTVVGHAPVIQQDCNLGFSLEPGHADTTNYLSTYTVDIAGKFCRAY